MMKKITTWLLLTLLLFTSINLWGKTIYLSSSGDDSNEGSMEKPVLTLHRAKQICAKSLDASFTILLKGGDVFTDHIPTVSDFDGDRTIAFIWDIDKALTISTYGPDEKAKLYGGFYKHNGGPVAAILITGPSSQDVLIENLSFEMWIEGSIIVYETEDVTIRNIRVDRIGTYYFEDETDRSAFLPAGIYPKNSFRVLIDSVYMSNVLNWKGDRAGLHGFYCTRLGDSEIRNCLLVNVCGSPFKFRREPLGRGDNNCYVHNNQCYYTGLSVTTIDEEDDSQPGFLRFSGEFYSDDTPNCPGGLIFENNTFHYPFCWDDEGKDPWTALAIKCSNSNERACGDNACSEDSAMVYWVDNDFKYEWDSTKWYSSRNDIPQVSPVNLEAVAVSDHQIDLTWEHDDLNEDRFVIMRKSETGSYKALVMVDSGATSYSDKRLLDSCIYSYRIKASRDNTYSGLSNEATDSTSGGVRLNAPVRLIVTASAGNEIKLWWLDKSNNEHGFSIERKKGEGEFIEVHRAVPNFTHYTDTGLEESEVYTYRVKAFRYDQFSSSTNEASDTAFSTTVGFDPQTEDPGQGLIQVPNPFSQNTNISYQLDEASVISLNIYNASGKLVEVLEKGHRAAGSYSVLWAPGDIATGVYFCRLDTGKQSLHRKMIYEHE